MEEYLVACPANATIKKKQNKQSDLLRFSPIA
jgi:hypothetical protein